MPKSKKSKEPELDIEVASQMLENIFAACEVEPNTIPLSVLASYSSYRRERFLLQKIVLAVIILLFCMVPLLFISPKFTIQDTTSQTGITTYEVKVNSFLPVEHVIATVGGRNIPVYETDDKTYSVQPSLNGEMSIRVTLKNRQTRLETIRVTSVDTEPPTVVSNRSDSQNLYIYLKDDSSGVDYKKITAKETDGDGTEITPSSYNETEGYVVFSYPQSSLNINIPDKAGNTLQLVLTLKEK